MAKQTKKSDNYYSMMDGAYKAAKSDTKRILNNGAKSAASVNKKISAGIKKK